jgi:HlyD family secretion protein
MSIFTHTRVLIGTGLLIAGTLLATSCSNVNPDNRGEAFQRQDPVPTVEVVEARYGSLALHERLTGRVTARNQTDIYPEIGGRIVEVLVGNGDRVRRGDTLVRIRDDELRERLNQAGYDRDVAQAQLRQAEASVTRLQVQYRRTRELVELGLESEIELETLEADIDQAEAAVDLARAQLRRTEAQIEEQKSALENTVVKAPIDGVVGNRNAEIGMRVDGGVRLFEIGDTSRMRVTVTLTEQWAYRFRQGDRVRIQSPYLDSPIEATIQRLSPFLDPVSNTTIAEVEVSNPGLRLQPGMFVSVDVFHGESEETLIVPKAALYEHPGVRRLGVYVAGVADPGPGSLSPFPGEAEAGRTQSRIGPAPVEFVPVEVATEDRESVSVRGLDDPWVVVNGQNQLAEWESREAYLRLVDWDRVLRLQRLQTRDLLQGINDAGSAGE